MGKRANGEGCIYQRKDGRWAAVISLGAGKRKFLYRPTQAEAVMALQLANHAKLEGTLTSTRNETVEEFLLTWLTCRVQPTVEESTYLVYRDLVTKHLLPTLGHMALQKVTALHIQHLYQVKLRQGYSAQMIHQIHKLLRAALEDAILFNHLFRNVCKLVTLPPVPRRERGQALTVEQSQHLLVTAQDDPLEALYVLALTTGLREGELLALTWADIDWSSGKVQVRQTLKRVPKKGLTTSEPKSRASRRCIQLLPLALDALKRHALRQQEARRAVGDTWVDQDWVFCTARGKPLHKSNLMQRSFRPLLRKAGLPEIRFHDLRHTTATLLLLLGTHPKVVQELLGHNQITVTLDIYSHVLPPLQEEAVARLQTLLTTPYSFSGTASSPSS